MVCDVICSGISVMVSIALRFFSAGMIQDAVSITLGEAQLHFVKCSQEGLPLGNPHKQLVINRAVFFLILIYPLPGKLSTVPKF